MDVSIVIINYKTSSLVKNCLESVQRESKGFTFEAIVVDNSNDQDELARLKAVIALFPFARIVDAHGNIGTSKGNNLGAKSCQGDFLFFLNSDTLLRNNAIFELLNCIKSDPRIGAVGPNLFDKNGNPAHSYLLNEVTLKTAKQGLSLFSPILARLGKNKEFNHGQRPIEVRGYICLAAELVSRPCFEAVQGFDEDIFMYSEDALFGHQLMAKGYKQVCTPQAEITHFEGASDEAVYSASKIQNMVNGSYIYRLKAFGKREAIQYMIIMSRSLHKRARRNQILKKKTLVANCSALSCAFKNKADIETK